MFTSGVISRQGPKRASNCVSLTSTHAVLAEMPNGSDARRYAGAKANGKRGTHFRLSVIPAAETCLDLPRLSQYVPGVALRAFPVLHAEDVERVAAFYVELGFEEQTRIPGEDGRIGFIGLRRDSAELAVTTVDAPRALAGIDPRPGPRHELFVYVDDVDRQVADLRDRHFTIVREPVDMPWGERVAYVADPEGNLVSLAGARAS
jgi:lactoylglutathione lyase